MKPLSLERSPICSRLSAAEWRGTGAERFSGGIGQNGNQNLPVAGRFISILVRDYFRGESEKAPNSMYKREVRDPIAVPI
ncbi:hypothetical protein V0288_02375 [Pannus brasiliensis CCIBt3594]|uniref:Uncharacterized protein n=1 Tax=Pannus brasiliensis CCIBt3594 TaxID=1427578 RepID=A0AAW9QRN5_9CHRO